MTILARQVSATVFGALFLSILSNGAGDSREPTQTHASYEGE